MASSPEFSIDHLVGVVPRTYAVYLGVVLFAYLIYRVRHPATRTGGSNLTQNSGLCLRIFLTLRESQRFQERSQYSAIF